MRAGNYLQRRPAGKVAAFIVFSVGGLIMSPSTFKELRKLMTQFLDDIEAAIKNIHVAHGITSDDITKQVADAVTTGITPLQSQINDLQGQVAELQKAAQDTV